MSRLVVDNVTVSEIGSPPTNGGETAIKRSVPYHIMIEIVGVADLLFHKWNCEAIDIKAAAKKGSKSKKTDDVQSYLWRNDKGEICLPAEYLRQSIIHAAKFRQDPRSPRKSAMDLYKAGIAALTPLHPLGNTYDFEDKRRAVVQRQGITRTRPAFKAGWKASFTFLVMTPEYIRPDDFQDVATDAGRLVGVGDFRPTYGRFSISKFDVITSD